ncbi:MAG: helix-turn-helix domain-containing protein [SAR324 cluster bacterium]|nr:helix-turn-helix domain-containing protein [SAR324 cluster bacterium]
MKPEFLTSEEIYSKLAALGFKISKDTIYRWIRDGVIKSKKMGQRVYVSQAEFNRVVEEGIS